MLKIHYPQETVEKLLHQNSSLFPGFVAVTSFGVLTKLVPTRVAFVTALAEAALNGAQAFGPFLGGVLYDAAGYR